MRHSNLKVLHLVPYNPVQPDFGGALRIYHVLQHLLNNYDVTVAGFGTKEQEEMLIQEFPQLKGKSYFHNHVNEGLSREIVKLKSVLTNTSAWRLLTQSVEFERIIDNLFKKEQFDLVISEFPVIGMYTSKYSVKSIINCHNVEYDNFRRMTQVSGLLKRWFYKKQADIFFKEETEALRQQNALLVTSNLDIDELEITVPGVPKYLVPNGVDTTFFSPDENIQHPHSLVFVGMMGYVPNYDGIQFFLEEVFPHVLKKYPDCTITIVGKNTPEFITSQASENVIITGFVEDTRPYINAASVYVVPLRMGSGTRLKVMEALAMKKPVVSTSIGCEGIDVTREKNILIEDDPKAFADAVMRLFENHELRSKLSENGHKLVHEKYDWQSVCKEIDTCISHMFSENSLKTSSHSSSEPATA